ncbi:MAG: acyltransferase [Actinomycetota bacterium]
MVVSQESIPATRQREQSVDTVRGIAITLLVLFHVVGFADTGLRLPDDHPVREFNALLIYVRMPLFTILSGYVYALRPFRGDVRGFVTGKARRLLIPMVVVGTLFALAQTFAPGTNDDVLADGGWRTLHIEPVAHFWFLEALFWVFLVVMLLEMAGSLDSVRRAAIVVVIGGTVSALVLPPTILGVRGAVYLFPFFVFGLALKRFELTTRERRRLDIGVPIAVVSLAICFVAVLDDDLVLFSRRSIPSLIAGCSAGYVLLAARFSNRWLAQIGVFSYTIYLLHTFGTSATRIALDRIGLDVLALQLIAGLAVGLTAPIAVDLLIRRWAWARLLILGRTRTALP